MSECAEYKSWRSVTHPLQTDECYWYDVPSRTCTYGPNTLHQQVCPWGGYPKGTFTPAPKPDVGL